MKKRILVTMFAMVMTVSMLAGCGSGEAANTDNTTSEAVEQQETISEATTENESESTEVAAESESADESAASGCEFTNIQFDENGFASFINNTGNMYCAGDINFELVLENSDKGIFENDLDQIVHAFNVLFLEHQESGIIPDFVTSMTHEIVTVDNRDIIKVTEETNIEEKPIITYIVPVQYNGEYVHNGVFSYVTITRISEYFTGDDNEVIEALQFLYL